MEVTVRPKQARELDGNTANLTGEMLPLKDSIHREYIFCFFISDFFVKKFSMMITKYMSGIYLMVWVITPFLTIHVMPLVSNWY